MPDLETPACDVDAIVARAFCLGGLLDRLTFETAGLTADAERRAQLVTYNADLLAWLEAEALIDVVSPKELRLLRGDLGSWTEVERIDVSWRAECLGVCAWALKLVDELPTYDTQFEPIATFSWVGESPAVLRARVQLRSAAELDEAEAQAGRWHWRAAQADGYSRGGGPPARSALIRRALGEEVVLFGKPYETLSFEELSSARSIASERHYALRWIWGGEPWDEVTTDTLGLSPAVLPLASAMPASRPRAVSTSNWSPEQLIVLLPSLPESADANDFAPRVADLLVRTGRARGLREFLDLFKTAPRAPGPELQGLLVGGYFAALAEKASPPEVANLFELQRAEKVKKAMLQRLIRLGRFQHLAAATQAWPLQDLVRLLPRGELERLSGGRAEAGAAFCRTRGLRHALVYREALRMGEIQSLKAWAREAASLDGSDFNGGGARQTLLRWAGESLLDETLLAGQIELAIELLAFVTRADQEPSLAALRERLAVAAVRGSRLELLPQIETSAVRSKALEAALLLASAESVATAAERLPVLTDDAAWAKHVAFFWEAVEAKGRQGGWSALQALAVRVRQTSSRDKKDRLDTIDQWASNLVRRACAAGAYDAALSESKSVADATGMRWKFPARNTVVHAAGVGGAGSLARTLAEGLSVEDARRLAPLLIDDWSKAALPADATLPEQLRWAVLALEATHGRSAAAEGFGIPDRV